MRTADRAPCSAASNTQSAIALYRHTGLTECDRPGSYLRRQNFQFHLQPNDGSSLFSTDATFCPAADNSGQGTSFQSVNFPRRYIRNFNNVVYLAANGGTNPWDTATGWPADTSWLVAAPWAPGGGN